MIKIKAVLVVIYNFSEREIMEIIHISHRYKDSKSLLKAVMECNYISCDSTEKNKNKNLE